jgi:hypothetical protein
MQPVNAMNQFQPRVIRWAFALGCVLATFWVNSTCAQIFTLQFGTGALPPVPLVNHGDLWRYHLGTNAPGAGWQTNAEVALDPVLWGTGPGGFGYEDGDDATVVVMSNRCTTIYIRKNFDITDPVDAARHLQLVMDYDDGFIAWLDGAELARSSNAPGAVGTEPPNTATSLAPNHEASAGAGGNFPSVLDLGLAGSRLQPGTHTLAILGLNGAINSSDLSLIADLSLTGGSSSVSDGNFFTLVTTTPITLSGTNTFPGSARVTINGVDAAFNAGAVTWTKAQSLVPGMNQLFIAALDATGGILFSTNRDVIYEAGSSSVSGTLGSDATWTSAMGIIHVTSDVVVPSGVTLGIDAGLVVLLPAGVSIRATAGGTINVNGTETNPTFFLPEIGSSTWGALNATGSGASVNVRHIETAGGSITFNTQATGLIEDSYLHDRASILTANSAGLITSRRIHVKNYEETIYNSGTLVLAEDSLYEGSVAANSDCLEIQGGPPGSIIRRCTFRRSSGSNSDAVDCNGTSGTLMESLLIHDITDKAISMGASGQGGSPDYGMVISNCLFYRVDTGIAVKDNGTASFFDTTIASSTSGIRCYQKFTTPVGGGHITNGFNNLIWGNGSSITLTEGGTVTTDFSDIEGTDWPGVGNINADPLFVDAANGDFHLSAGSPAIGSGTNGANMGVAFPVGGLPSAPFNLAALTSVPNQVQLIWQEDADNEMSFVVERSPNGASWQVIGTSPADSTNFLDNAIVADQTYFYRVRATNTSGASAYSNIASGNSGSTATLVGGTLAANTTWSPSMGMILVTNTVTVPAGLTLTIQAGTVVKVTNVASIHASSGGVIDVQGSADSPVLVTRWNGTNVWGEIAADGGSSSLAIRHAEITGGAVKFRNGATGLMEDCYVHDYKSGTTPIAGCTSAASVTVRRCHFNVYYETLWQFTLMLIEDSLFENANEVNSDALDFDGAPLGSVIRRCTFRHGPRSNTDAIDLGSGTQGTLVEDCLMFDFPNDKGVSIGEDSFGIVIRNCLMYGCDSGVAVKDNCTASIYGCTIGNNDFGLRAYNKANPASPTGGGHITNSYNNILWNNGTNVSLLNASTLVADHSDIPEPNVIPVPGDFVSMDNIESDPLFVNATAALGHRDYQLQPGSPCANTGRDETAMGAILPVGAAMAPSNPFILTVGILGTNAVIGFWADSEKSYSVQCSPDASAGPWSTIASVPTNSVPHFLNMTNAVVQTNRFYRLVSP